MVDRLKVEQCVESLCQNGCAAVNATITAMQKDLDNIIPGENLIHMDISYIENGVYSCRIQGDPHVLSIQNLIISH